jgi:predicted O-linked N-acetylglucosamine transferase (SPINDLY family)
MAFTQGCRPGIFARRAAPIQVNYLGYPGTMATDFMDYLIADRTVISEHEQDHYAEKIVFMPDCYIPNDPRRAISDTPGRAEFGLPEAGFVFCSINNSYKFTPEMFDVWMRLLTAVEGSVLWLPQSNSAAVRNLDAEAAARGVSPDRLVFATLVAKSEDHLARLRLADLFLDTLPYNAHSTACEALWAGLPVLTCMGKTFAGRVAASVLRAAGLPEMVTRSLSEYEARALGLARDPQALAEVKAKLAGSRHTHALFDARRFARHLEKAYRHMVERHRKGEPPMSFAVEALDHVANSTVS